MARNFIIRTAFEAKDGLTKRFGLMTRAAARFGSGATKAFRNAARSAGRFNKVTTGFLKAQVIGKGVGMLTQGIGAVTRGFIAFDKAALGATVRFKDIGPEAANFDDQLKIIEKSARDAGAATQFTAAQAAEGLDFLARAGFSSTEAMGSLTAMINLAVSTGEDFARVADMSSDLLGAFGMNSEVAAEKIANLSRLNDVLVKSANSANVTIEDMFETMKTAGPVGRIVGASLEEVAAATAILGNAGIKGTEAGTALKNAMLNISAPTPQMLDMMNAIGVSTDDGTGNMKKFSVIIAEVGNAIKDMGNIKQAKVLDTIFGKRAIAGSKNLIDSITQLDKFEETLKNAAGTSQKTADIMGQGIGVKLLSLGSAATEAGFKILNAFRNDGKGGIDALTESIRNADMQPFIEALRGVATVAKGVFDLVNGIGKGIAYIAYQTTRLRDSQVGSGGGFDADFDPDAAPTGGFFQKETPNKAEAQARSARQSKFEGTLNVMGAPTGSTLETSNNTAGLELNLGFN